MNDIHDIKALIIRLPFWREHFILLLGVGLLVVLVFLFIYFKFIRNKKEVISDAIPKLTPYEEAMKALVEAEEFMRPGLDKVLSIQLSDLIRRYIEDAFHLQASEKTSEEFLYDIKHNHAFSTKCLEILSIFLEMCDLAKFAKAEFTHNEQKVLFEKATLFLEIAHKEEIENRI